MKKKPAMPQHFIAHAHAAPAATGTGGLPQALRAAIAARHTQRLHALQHQHGASFFAHALTALTQRQQADILSLLAAQERADVYRHLPASARRQWLQASAAARMPLHRRMLCTCQRHWQWLRHALGFKLA